MLAVSLTVLISARHLVDRLRQPRARADQLRALRERLECARRVGATSDGERVLGEELRRLRERLDAALGAVRSCSACAAGHPEPFGHWPGGHCCGGRTEEIFTDDELAALAHAGTTPGRLTPPRAELAGCIFRGPSGCSLAVRDRPNLCVRFLCRELEAELRERGDRREISALQAELGRGFARLAGLRAEAVEAAEPAGRLGALGD